MIRAVEPTMRKQGKGAVVNVSSIAGVMGTGSSVAYSASKGALNTMTLSLARVLGPHIRVNAVCPGFVETRWLKGAFGDRYETAKSNVAGKNPLQSTSTPEDISRAIVWLLEGADHGDRRIHHRRWRLALRRRRRRRNRATLQRSHKG